MMIETVYHWSPRSRREDILREGLKVYSNSVTHSAGKWPYICFSTDPKTAWSISGDMEWNSDEELWDLWQVTLTKSDEIHIRSEFGPYIYEVRVRNSIPADRCWWVGEREPLAMIEEPKPKKKTTRKNAKKG